MSQKRKSYSLSFKSEAIDYAEKNSKEAAARKYGVDSKQIREWCKKKDMINQVCTSPASGKKKMRLEGAGRKPTSETMERLLVEWIEDMRCGHLRVTRKMIAEKALDLFSTNKEVIEETGDNTFVGSNGWLCRFFERHGITVRRKTTMGQKLPEVLAPKLIQFILYIRSLRIRNNYSPADIIALDETAVWFDMPGDTTVDKVGVKSVPLRTTGHEKQRITVVLAAKSSGKKVKPMLVYKGSRKDPEVEKVMGVHAVQSHNGWMNQKLTEHWVTHLLGQMCFSRSRLLVWDSYRCHISDETKKFLRKFKIDLAVIPGGCTGVIQAPDVSWNAPFKANIRGYYDKWMATGEKTYTAAGNMRAPTRALMAEWVCDAWEALPEELIRKSFQTCALTNNLESDNSVKEIHCLKEGGIIHTSLDEVVEKCRVLRENGGDIAAVGHDAMGHMPDDEQNELVVEED